VRIYNTALDTNRLEAVRQEGAAYKPTGLPFNLSIQANEGAISRLSWPSEAGRFYQVWTTDNLMNTNWVKLGEPVEGNGSVVILTNIMGGNIKFFQVGRRRK